MSFNVCDLEGIRSCESSFLFGAVEGVLRGWRKKIADKTAQEHANA